MGRRSFNQGHVTDRAAARDAAFQQVVAEHLAFRQAAGQHGVQGVRVQQAFAGEAAFAEQVLVDLGRDGVVGVAAAVAGKQVVEARGLARGGPGGGNARLQDAVAGDHAALLGVHPWPVQRVGCNAHQFAQHARRQHGVAVQGDDVGRAGAGPRGAAQVQEMMAGAAGQQRHQLLQFAAFALPAYPALFTFTPLPGTVQQQKTLRRASHGRVACVQAFNGGPRLVQQGFVAGRGGSAGVGVVGQQCKLRMGFAVGQVVAFQALHQRGDGGGVAKHGRHHHQHAVRRRYAVGQRQARQAARRHRLTDQPVQPGAQHLAGRPQRQQRAQCAPCGAGVGRAQRNNSPGQGRGAQAERGQQRRQRQLLPACAAQAGAQAQRAQQGGTACALQPVAQRFVRGWPAGVVGRQRLARQGQHLRGHRAFAAAAAAGQFFDGVQRGVLRVVALGGKGRPGQQAAHQHAGLRDEAAPVGTA